MIHTTATIEVGADIGPGTRIWHWTHVMPSASIGRDCNIGQSCFVEGIVGDCCKIQNNVSVYKGVILGSNVFVGPSAVFTNDPWPRAWGDEWELVETRVENYASIAANATIKCGVTIGEGAMVGCGAVVTKDVEPWTVVVGNPATFLKRITPRR